MANSLEKRLWRRVRFYLSFLRIVPFVKMVAVCNNLALGKVTEESDIDLFIVAKRGRLFTVRLLVTFILHILGVRRHGDKVSGRFCLSFFIDETYSNLSPIALEDDYYLAFWINSLAPVIDRQYYDHFFNENRWIKKFCDESFSGSKRYLFSFNPLFDFFRLMLSVPFSFFWGDFIEDFFKKWQLKRAREKAEIVDDRASLIVKENILKFHNLDRRDHYRQLVAEEFGLERSLTNSEFLSVFN